MSKKINILLCLLFVALSQVSAQQVVPKHYQEQLKTAKDDYTRALLYLQIAKEQAPQNNSVAQDYAHIAQVILGTDSKHSDLRIDIANTLTELSEAQAAQLRRANRWLWSVFSLLSLGFALGLFYFIKKKNAQHRQLQDLQQLTASKLDLVKAELVCHEEQLAQAQQTIDQFAQIDLQHLQSPLVELTNFMSLVDKKLAHTPSKEMREYLSSATAGIKEMHQLMTDMVAFSKIKTAPETISTVNLNESIFESIQKLSTEIQAKNAIIACAELPVITANQNHIQQLFEQIMSNGLKYNNSQQPQLEIQHRTEIKEHIFSIKDNGIGLPEAYQNEAFKVFKKVPLQQGATGSGMGLAACKKIVDQMKGKIWFTSQIDQGTTFYFSIPREKGNTNPLPVKHNLN